MPFRGTFLYGSSETEMIPNWTLSGILPPVRPGAPGHHPDRSPYITTMAAVVERFATSAARRTILRGLLNYRTEFRLRSVQQGFQWLNGSFMEHKEILLDAAPKDIDVVTFFKLPEATDQRKFLTDNMDLFEPEAAKAEYKVDAYPFVIGEILTAEDVRQICYWYSMWSHRRSGLWKGFLQVEFSQEDDNLAVGLLEEIEMAAVNP